MSHSYGLVHAFMNQSKDFVLGFEVGKFYQVCENGDVDPDETYTFHQENKGEVLRVADKFNLTLEHREDYGMWAYMKFSAPE